MIADGPAMLRLADTIDETVALLRANDEPHFAERIVPMAELVRLGNPSAVQHILSEVTGSMGSLRDLILYANGVRLPANETFERLVESMRNQAQAILHRRSHA